MNAELVENRAIIIALILLGLYAFFALVDLIKTKGDKQMKKVKFEFNDSYQIPVTEVFEFEDETTEAEIEKEFREWFFNELDIAGIGGNFEEVVE